MKTLVMHGFLSYSYISTEEKKQNRKEYYVPKFCVLQL